MDGVDARISVRLEINALLYALRAEGEKRLAPVHDILSIRAERHRHITEANRNGEASVEIAEGTAVYTQVMMGWASLEDRLAFIEKYKNMGIVNSMRMFGYHTGALYGLLLDELGISWRYDLDWDSDLSAILKEAIGFTQIIPFYEINLEHYGYSEIRLAEEAWVTEYENLIKKAHDALYGPLLLLCTQGDFHFFDDMGLMTLYVQDLEMYSHEVFDYGQEDVHLLSSAYIDDDGNTAILEDLIFYGNFVAVHDFSQLPPTNAHFHNIWLIEYNVVDG
jgi:hypothetical protein